MRATIESRIFRKPAITITIEAFELERMGEEGQRILAAFTGSNHGDWGGAEYPEYTIPPEAETKLLDVLRAATCVGAG